MSALTQDYLEQHENVLDEHHYHQLGRQLFALALSESRRIIGDGEAEKLNLQMDVEVSPYAPKDCIKICIRMGDGHWWCMNQESGELEMRENEG